MTRIVSALAIVVGLLMLIACSGAPTATSDYEAGDNQPPARNERPSSNASSQPKSDSPEDSLSQDERRWMAMLRSTSWVIPKISPKTMTVGSFGHFRSEAAKISQVIDSDSVLMEIDDETVLLHRIGTGKMVDDRWVSLSSMAFEVDGTTTYVTLLGGTRTVFTIRPITLERIESIAAQERARIEKEIADRLEDEKYRDWFDKDGKLLAHAKFEKFERDLVHLRAKDGTLTTCSSMQLTPNDRSWMQGHLGGTKTTATAARSAESLHAAAQQRQDSVQLRKWMSLDSSFECEAKIKSLSPLGVTLIKSDGTEIKVDPAKLCDVDREYIQEWKKSR